MKKILPILLWWLVLSILWGIFRLFDSTEIIFELIAKPIIWLGITALFLKIKVIPKDVLSDLKNFYLTKKPILKIVVLPIIAITFYFILINFRQLSFIQFKFTLSTIYLLISSIIINFSTAIVEETIYRGIMYIWLLRKTNEVIAFILVQVLFLLGHLPILLLTSNSVSDTLIRSFFILLLGSIHTGIFRLNKSLYSSILSHGVWNTLIAVLLLS
ncbi:MAG: hypothetical protein COZ34_04070 [Candidatus Pacebacteria bacterium CG_4_10_14_3_um_filter_34_15]|nr:CPBP family intramembrane metalloprotease [Candidatus Pacearchaeota archaeon]NCQ65743.1 CPBP family intramembrane metalloprotease [Candidatus Paceibacterota bacterium]OIO45097.1 MAG: hypothetical protein AUJ41_00865 [Candidatus Pacebacteria bacterium CG1_02_43_31]PIQ80839.1 MAG: hypothetical protein COV78_03410 [Candidatus Pacebacteria bacterium CG11_big_fil_rev_8_21_14_0_20_34_55]PIX81287.1 MAG: hypothetical protein COZ34_04070 [Candidatus Pacebacteria bacterium CG_4_10_14_3_um_filter_34_15